MLLLLSMSPRTFHTCHPFFAGGQYRGTLVCLAAIVFMVKGLGGSFNALFTAWGGGLAHGPLVGSAIFILIAASVFANTRERASNDRSTPPFRLGVFFAVWSLLVVAAIVLRVNALKAYPMDPWRADMLPAVMTQLRDFLSGASPYGSVRLDTGEEIVRVYWPVLWGSYFPFYLAGIDIRYLNLTAHLVFYLLLTDCFLQRRSFFGWGFGPSAALFIAVMALHVFSKQAIRDVYDIQTGPYWLFYSLFLWAICRDKFNVATLALPFVLLCRQPAVLLFIPYWVWLAKTDRGRFAKSLGFAIAGGLAIALPFVRVDPAGFFRGLTFYASLAVPLEERLSWYGLSGLLSMFDALWLQLPLQVAGLAACCFWVFKSNRHDTLWAVGAGTVAYAWFLLFVPVTFKYLFVEPLLFLTFLLCRPLIATPVPEPKAA